MCYVVCVGRMKLESNICVWWGMVMDVFERFLVSVSYVHAVLEKDVFFGFGGAL